MTSQAEHVQDKSQANLDFLVENVASNLHLHAIQVVTIAASVSAAMRSGETTLLRSCRHLLHDNGKAMLLALKFGADIGFAASLVVHLSAAYKRVVDGKLALKGIVEASGSRQGRDQWQAQAIWWRRAAAETLKAVELFDEGARGRLSSVYAEDTRAVRQALQKAANDDASLVDRSGFLVLPRLRQRRQSPRLAVDRACTVHLSAGAVQAHIEDMSREGLGIVCAQPLVEGQQLKITLDNGTKVEAVVAAPEARFTDCRFANRWRRAIYSQRR